MNIDQGDRSRGSWRAADHRQDGAAQVLELPVEPRPRGDGWRPADREPAAGGVGATWPRALVGTASRRDAVTSRASRPVPRARARS